jgi:hypothetical protein
MVQESFTRFRVVLADKVGAYMAGTTIRGQVELAVIERFKINALKLKLVGQARVKWTETKGNGRFEASMTTYSDSETYLDFSVVLLSHKRNGNPKSGKDLYLEPGFQAFPFEIFLPASLPSSVEHRDGKIRYSLQSLIEIPWSLSDKVSDRVPITVVCHSDLNKMPRLKLFQGFFALKISFTFVSQL